MDNEIPSEANDASDVVSEDTASNDIEVMKIYFEAEERRRYGVIKDTNSNARQHQGNTV